MKYYLPEIVFKTFNFLELDKDYSLEELDNLFCEKHTQIKYSNSKEQEILNISLRIIDKAIEISANKNDFQISFSKKNIVINSDMNNRQRVFSFLGDSNNLMLLIDSFENLSDDDFFVFNKVRERLNFNLIDNKKFSEYLYK